MSDVRRLFLSVATSRLEPLKVISAFLDILSEQKYITAEAEKVMSMKLQEISSYDA